MEILRNHPLKPYNTFGIQAVANYFAVFTGLPELKELLKLQPADAHLRLVLGGGSNILFTKDFNGFVLKNEVTGIEVINEDKEHVWIKTGAGENWHQFVMYCVSNGYAGIENMALIPGSNGASPMQNIGAYGVEIKDVFHELEALHINDLSLQTFDVDDCQFGYRESVFKNKYKGQFVITSVTFRLHKKPVFNTTYGAIQQELEKMKIQELSIAAIAQAVINIRTSKLPDPKEVGNAGSFFKNPTVSSQLFEDIRRDHPTAVGFPVAGGKVKLAAGWLIEQCGWKGYRKGDAGCYPKQALVLVNYGTAHGSEILELSEAILQSVKEKFGVLLEREVNII